MLELVVAKVLGAQGSGQGSDVTAGIKWVVDHGAKVVNLSLGDPAQPITALISRRNAGGHRLRLEQGRHPRPGRRNSNTGASASKGRTTGT